jgi:hypothetical protein
MVISPTANASGNKIGKAIAQYTHQDNGRHKQNPPEKRLPVLDNPTNPVGHPAHGALI